VDETAAGMTAVSGIIESNISGAKAMNDAVIVLKGTISEDGRLVITLPPDAPRGDVEVVVRSLPAAETDAAAALETLLNDPATFDHPGATMGEIAASQAVGLWKNRAEMDDPVEWLAQQRRSTSHQ
jgi:hypothetical protein